MTLLLFYVALSIGVSFLCSILEAVLLSITPAYIATREEEAPEQAAKLKEMKENIDRPLAAILSLNTFAHTIGAAGAGAQAAYVFGDWVITTFSIVLTLAVLILSEIIPKTIGATYWKGLAGVVATILPWLIFVTWPFVKLSQGITYLMGGKGEHTVSREEITAMADIGVGSGIVAEGESRILRNLFALDTLTARDVMTPRTVIFALKRTMTVGEVMAEHPDIRFSRIPIFEERLDQIDGFVLKDDVLLRAARDEDDVRLDTLKRKLTHVAEDMGLRSLFEAMVENGDHIALVSDEYGGTTGIVTMEDVVETLLGLEIVDEADHTDDLQAYARTKWAERARKLGIEPPTSGQESELETASPVISGITGGAPAQAVTKTVK